MITHPEGLILVCTLVHHMATFFFFLFWCAVPLYKSILGKSFGRQTSFAQSESDANATHARPRPLMTLRTRCLSSRHGVSPISESDYFLKNAELRVWLKDEKDKVCRLYTICHGRHAELSPKQVF